MLLSEIIKGIDCKVYGNIDQKVESITHNSKDKQTNGLFFAIVGDNFNGEEFAIDAVKNGAKVVVSENKLNINATNVVVKDTRQAMSLIARNFYFNPAKSLLIIGVTGTNGKTTTTYILKSIFEKAGKKVGVIGTNGIIINGEKFSSDFTTPDPILLQKTLAKMRERGVNVVCMEVSAHALKLQKLWGVMTDIALFTNLTQDHLDFFYTMDNYFSAKQKYFTKEYSRFGVVNIDDQYGKIINETSEIPLVTYSTTEENADVGLVDISLLNNFQEFSVKTMKGEFKVKMNLLGDFNVSNALGAIAVAIMAGVNKNCITKALEKIDNIEGRFNTFDFKGVRVVVDYAHTPDGLENILKSTKKITKNRLISVFGCGGNRDVTKRPIMGEISTKYADYTIITTDNPRYEDPLMIVKDIELGVLNKNYMIESDRYSAIKKALNIAKNGDTVVILGKGAEKYFDIKGEKIPYKTDMEVVKEIIDK